MHERQQVDVRDVIKKVQIDGGGGLFKASIQLVEKNSNDLRLDPASPVKKRGRTIKEYDTSFLIYVSI
jgi:hypothetical protein